MALPVGVETVTVSSDVPLTRPDGSWIEGALLFTGPDLATIAEDDVVFGGGVLARLVDGEFTVRLVATDATGLSPTGGTYTVTSKFTNAPNWVRYISLPKANPSVKLAEVLVPDPVTGEFAVLVDGDTLLAKTANLADLDDPAAARANLELGEAATLHVGTEGGTVAAGDDPRFSQSKPWVFDVTAAAYGAAGDAQVVADGAMLSGSAVLTSATAAWPPSVVGKTISVKGAGPAGVTTLVTTVASRQSSTQITLNAPNASGSNLTGGIVIWGTDDTASIQAAVNAAETYLATHTYAQVYFPPRAYVVAGALNRTKSGNGQIVFGVYPTTGNKKILEFVGEGDGAAAVRHWEQLVPQHAGSCLISLGVYASIPAQSNDISSYGNPALISGPNEGTGNGLAYGAAARFSNIIPGLKNLAILNTHSAFGLGYGAYNFYGCANARLENVGWSTAGVVPGSDYTSPGQFANGLSIGGLLPAPGNNDLVVAKNISIGGGYTYGIFCTEHLVNDRIMVLYCWSAICLVGTYAGSVGSVHAILIESASVEACINEVYIVGAGSGGVGPIVDILQLSTESSTPNVAGNSQVAVNSALGTIRLTGIFSEGGVTTQYPTGIEIINGQVPAAIKRKTSAFTVSPIDRVLICDTTVGGAFTGTLPAADFCPVEYAFKNVGSSTLTVGTTGGQLIYTTSGTGATTAALTTGQTLRVRALYNGTSWGWYAI